MIPSLTSRPDHHLIKGVALFLMLTCTPVQAEQVSASWDLTASELVFPSTDGFWKVESVSLDLESLTIRLAGRARRDQEQGTFLIGEATRIVAFDEDLETAARLLSAEGVEIGEETVAPSLEVALSFPAPPGIVSAIQLVLDDGQGGRDRVPLVVPGALQARDDLAGALIAEEKRDWAEATIRYRRVAESRPSYHLAWRGLGRALVRMRDNTAAIAPLERAITVEPDNAYDRALLGFAILYTRTDPEDGVSALEHLEAAKKLGYDWSELGYFIASAHELAGDLEAARAGYEEYLVIGRSPANLGKAQAFLAAAEAAAAAERAGDVPTPETTADEDLTEDAPAVEPVPDELPGRISFPLEGVADFGIERVHLVAIFLGDEDWVLRLRPETSHRPGTGTALIGAHGDEHALMGVDDRGEVQDLTFGAPHGRARTVTLRLVDEEDGATGDRTFEVPGYDEYRDAVRRGHRALGDELFQDAVVAYSTAIRYRAGDPDLWWRRGTAYRRAGRLELALADLIRAAGMASENPDILAALGGAQLEAGAHEDAAASLTRARDLGADTPGTLIELGRALTASGDSAGARASYQAVIDRFSVGSQADEARRLLEELGD